MNEKLKGFLMVLFSLSIMCGAMLWMDGIEGLLFVLKLIGTMIALIAICVIFAKGCVKLFH